MWNWWKKAGLLLLVAFLAGATQAEEADSIAPYMEGRYLVVGRHADSEKTYQGQIVLTATEKGFKLTRSIDGKTTEGTAVLGDATADKLPVLRIYFEEEGKKYEGIYQWKTDLDNYFRFTGYIFIPSATHKVPGLEVWFPAAALED